jgi:NAD(P)-dependent dehydrogenase (short-subunit alcohol dehydrogenase family)
MLLKDKSAIVYGAAGSVGGTVAQALAAEGARVLLAGRNAAPLEAIAEKIEAAGGTADVATVDALDEAAVEAHADAAGPVDISFNAISLAQTGIQGTRIVDLSPEAFDRPIATYTRATS